MKLVKLTKQVGNRAEGEVLRMDEASAASLVDKKKVATYFDPEAADATEPVERGGPRRGGVLSQQVVEDDPYPGSAPATDTEPADDPDADTTVDEPDELNI